MKALMDLWGLVVASCGIEFLIVLLSTELILFIGAAYLLWAMRHQHALGVYLPLTTLPIFLGGFQSLMTLSKAVSLMQSVQTNSAEQADGVLLLGMSAIPLLLGVVVTIPAFTVVAISRALLIWHANREPRAPKPKMETKNSLASLNGDRDRAEADDYISQLTRHRN